MVVHEYDDKDDGDKGFYYGPSYSPELTHYDDDVDKTRIGFDHDHYRFLHSYGPTDGHHHYTYDTGFKSNSDDKDKKADSKLPKKFAGKDNNGKKYHYSYYNDYRYPTGGFKEDFTKPKHFHKSLDSGYEVKAIKSTGSPLKILSVTPTKATIRAYGPTKSSYKITVGPTINSFGDPSGFIVDPQALLQPALEPTIAPYKKSHSSTPLSDEFDEYNTRKELTEGYILDNKPPFSFPASHLQSPAYDNVKDGIVGFASDIRERYGGKGGVPDKNTLEYFRKEDEEDAKAHQEFVSSIENDHKTF